jgi:hypothetical protein
MLRIHFPPFRGSTIGAEHYYTTLHKSVAIFFPFPMEYFGQHTTSTICFNCECLMSIITQHLFDFNITQTLLYRK